MARIEEIEMEAHRARMRADVTRLVDKYLAIFEWDVPEVDETLSQRLIIKVLRQALDDAAVALTAAEPHPPGAAEPAR